MLTCWLITGMVLELREIVWPVCGRVVDRQVSFTHGFFLV